MPERKYSFPRPKYFDLDMIFDCGQCFRFERTENEGEYEGVAKGRYIRLLQSEKEITIYGSDEQDFNEIWKHYLALDCDYEQIRSDIADRFGDDPTIRSAMEAGLGIRILCQDPWETVCSFIISQNNNIPRIKKIISALCASYGEKILAADRIYYSFPTAKALYDAGEEAIFALKTGFRAKYIYDAAKRVVRGELDLDGLLSCNTEELLCELMKVKGIGLKVASCAALFGFSRTDAFPVDVWVKRVIEKYYGDGLDISSLGQYAGIAQQYLFYYERYSVENKK